MFDKKVQEMLTEIMFEEKAEKWVKDNLHSTEEDYNKAFVDGAKFGYNEKYSEFEKELKWERDTKAELAEHLGKANDKVAELEAQIEQMKCCYNCKHSRNVYEHCRTDKREKWEIKEK